MGKMLKVKLNLFSLSPSLLFWQESEEERRVGVVIVVEEWTQSRWTQLRTAMGSLPLVPTLCLRVSERRQGPARERRSGQARQLAFPAGYRLLGSEEGEKSILWRDAARGRPTFPPAMEPWEPKCLAFSLSQPNLSQLASAKERANRLDALHATLSVCVLACVVLPEGLSRLGITW